MKSPRIWIVIGLQEHFYALCERLVRSVGRYDMMGQKRLLKQLSSQYEALSLKAQAYEVVLVVTWTITVTGDFCFKTCISLQHENLQYGFVCFALNWF